MSFWFLAGICALLVALLLARAYPDPKTTPQIAIVVDYSLLGGSLLLILGGVRALLVAKARVYERHEQIAIDTAGAAVREVTSTQDTIGFLNANQRQMEAYATIALSQAATSHRTAQLAMVTAFMLLIVGGIIAFLAPDTTTKVATAALAAIGTSLSAFISRTLTAAQRRATEQMEFYFGQPLIQS
jgi:hypothetical protein